MNIQKIVYWIATGLMCLIFLFSAYMYFFKHEVAVQFYQTLGFPTWIIYPLAVAKVLAVVAILTKQSRFLKEWAYAGLFFDAVLATVAHYFTDGGYQMSIAALVLIIVSRVLDEKFYGRD